MQCCHEVLIVLPVLYKPFFSGSRKLSCVRCYKALLSCCWASLCRAEGILDFDYIFKDERLCCLCMYDMAHMRLNMSSITLSRCSLFFSFCEGGGKHFFNIINQSFTCN